MKKLKRFKLMEVRNPLSVEYWYDGFRHGAVVSFPSMMDGVAYIKKRCEKYGSSEDKNYDLYGPYLIPCKDNGDLYV